MRARYDGKPLAWQRESADNPTTHPDARARLTEIQTKPFAEALGDLLERTPPKPSIEIRRHCHSLP